VAQKIVGLVESDPRGAINEVVQIIFAATNVPQRFPPLAVPPGVGVSLRGVNGATVNTNDAYVARYQDSLNGAGRMVIAPSFSTSVSYPADNLGQIWCMGTAGDGLLASIAGVSVG